MSTAPRPRNQAVILDLDGTLADSLDDITNAVNHALSRQQRPALDRMTVRSMVGDGLPTLMARAGDTSDPHLIASLVERFREHYHTHYLAHTRLYPGAERFLDRCRQEGVALAVLSNKPHVFTLLICDELLDRWEFGVIMGAHEGLPAKPHPAAAMALLDVLQREPADTLFVGDSVVDVETARAAGTRSVAVSWGFQDRARLEAAGPDHVVDDFEQLWDAILTAGPAAD